MSSLPRPTYSSTPFVMHLSLPKGNCDSLLWDSRRTPVLEKRIMDNMKSVTDRVFSDSYVCFIYLSVYLYLYTYLSNYPSISFIYIHTLSLSISTSISSYLSISIYYLIYLFSYSFLPIYRCLLHTLSISISMFI